MTIPDRMDARWMLDRILGGPGGSGSSGGPAPSRRAVRIPTQNGSRVPYQLYFHANNQINYLNFILLKY